MITSLPSFEDSHTSFRCYDGFPSRFVNLRDVLTLLLTGFRHAIILFVQPIRRRFGIVTGSTDLRVGKMKDLLAQNLHRWEGMEQLLLWILVSGGIEATTVQDQLWFASIIATYPAFEDMDEREYVCQVRSFIWMDDIFEAPMFQLMAQVSEVKNAAPVWPIARARFDSTQIGPCQGNPRMTCSRALYSTLSNLLNGSAEETTDMK